jgi:hypothetical protein
MSGNAHEKWSSLYRKDPSRQQTLRIGGIGAYARCSSIASANASLTRSDPKSRTRELQGRQIPMWASLQI